MSRRRKNEFSLDHPKAAFIRTMNELSYGRHRWKAFQDFCELGALTFANAFTQILPSWQVREDRHIALMQEYKPEERTKLSFCLSCITQAFENDFGDPLGEVFMEMDLGSHWGGQYFTPYPLCSAMARLTIDIEHVRAQEVVTLMEPAVGSGAMIIAKAETMHAAGVNFQQCMHVHATDVDIVSVHMAYIQLSMLHIPAIIVHGNSLSRETWGIWRTPAHDLGLWDYKLRRVRREQEERDGEADSIPDPAISRQDAPDGSPADPETTMDESIKSPDLGEVSPDNAKERSDEIVSNSVVSKGGQMVLF